MATIFNTDISVDRLNDIRQNTLISHIGIDITEVGADFIQATMPVDHRTRQPFGLLHGGASAVLAETLGSMASTLLVDTTMYIPVGIELNINHLKSATSGMVTGTVKPIRIGKQLHVWNIEISNEQNDLIAVSRLTVMIVSKKQPA